MANENDEIRKGAELGNCKTCHLGKARFALEKAEVVEVAE